MYFDERFNCLLLASSDLKNDKAGEEVSVFLRRWCLKCELVMLSFLLSQLLILAQSISVKLSHVQISPVNITWSLSGLLFQVTMAQNP